MVGRRGKGPGAGTPVGGQTGGGIGAGAGLGKRSAAVLLIALCPETGRSLGRGRTGGGGGRRSAGAEAGHRDEEGQQFTSVLEHLLISLEYLLF